MALKAGGECVAQANPVSSATVFSIDGISAYDLISRAGQAGRYGPNQGRGGRVAVRFAVLFSAFRVPLDGRLW